MMDWKRLDAAVTELLYPGGLACLACGKAIFGPLLCDACREELETRRLTGALCPDCGGITEEDGSCRRCKKYGRIDARSVWHYRGAASGLIRLLKDDAVAEAAEPLCRGIADCIEALKLPEVPLITWVPMPKLRYNVRGIDHGRILAEGTAALLDIPCRCLLERTKRDSHTQRGLSGEERRQNLAGSFRCGEKLTGTILMIDDVLTTGATAAVCTKELLKAGAEKVIAVTAARA